MEMFEKIRRQLKEEIQTVKDKDPAARNTFEILLTYSGLHAVLMYRVSHWFYQKKLFTVARAISQIARFFTGIEIHPGAKIGKGLFIDHGSGVVIGETTEIGDDCLIYQGVTLGGTGKEKGKRHPTLGNNVMVGSGARVLGPFKVGDNAKIAANAVVLEEVPPDCTAVGVPARIVKRNGRKICDLDQIHIPDPISQELCKQLMRIEKLEKQVEGLNGGKKPAQKKKTPAKTASKSAKASDTDKAPSKPRKPRAPKKTADNNVTEIKTENTTAEEN